jgi:putative lipoprotein
LRLAYLMARISEFSPSHVSLSGCTIFRRSLAVALAVAVFLMARPSAQAAEPDPWFGRDKVMHLSVSFALSGTSYATAAGVSKRTSVRVLAGAGVALSAGIAKELYDRSSGGDASWRDLTWDAIGTATGTLVAWLVDRYLF